MAQTFVANPAFLHLRSADGSILYGCDQDWFPGLWQKKAGCGPCTLANIMLYLSRAGKLPHPLAAKDEQSMVPIMKAMWGFVTPGIQGLNSTARFVQGANQALEAAESPLRAKAFDIKSDVSRQEGVSAIHFIQAGLADAPIAFLSLLRKPLGNLEPWHWVTVAGLTLTGNDAALHIYDNGLAFDLNFKDWLEAGGVGGFVALA